MSRVLEYIAEKYFPIRRKITKEQYEKVKSELKENEFKDSYVSTKDSYNDVVSYHELISSPTKESEVNILLLSKLLDQQAVATSKLSTIAGIMVFSLILSIVSFIIALIVIF